MFKFFVLIFILIQFESISIQAKAAGLVDKLENSTKCSETLRKNENVDGLVNIDKINCRILKEYLDKIEKNSEYRSFKRTKYLIKTWNILSKKKLEIPELKKLIEKEFNKNISKLGNLSKFSFTENRKFDNANLFFLGFEIENNNLYIVEGIKKNNEVMYGKKLFTKTVHSGMDKKPLVFLYKKNSKISYSLLDHVNVEDNATKSLGFYLGKIKTLIPFIEGMNNYTVHQLGVELNHWLKLNMELNGKKKKTCNENPRNTIFKKVTTNIRLNFRKNPFQGDNVIGILKLRTPVFLPIANDGKIIVRENNFTWVCAAVFEGYLQEGYLYQPYNYIPVYVYGWVVKFGLNLSN